MLRIIVIGGWYSLCAGLRRSTDLDAVLLRRFVRHRVGDYTDFEEPIGLPT